MASKKVTVTSCKVRGKRFWQLRRWVDGKVVRTFYTTKTEADTAAGQLRHVPDEVSVTWSALSAGEREELAQTFCAAKAKGVDFTKAIGTAEAINQGVTLRTAIDDFLAAKSTAGREKRYVDQLRVILNQFALSLELSLVSQVSLSQVSAFQASKGIRYRSTIRSRLSTFFRFTVRRGWRIDNPCDRLEAVSVTHEAPSILSTEQFKAAVEWLVKNHPSGLVWFALSCTCGLRPEEAEKTARSQINYKEGYIEVQAQTSKLRQRRIVYPKPEAMKFLLWAVSKGGEMPMTSEGRRYLIRLLRKALKFKKWPKDVTRHTAASYWLAGGSDIGHVADMMGNSPNILKRHYKALVTTAQAVEFWNAVAQFPK